MPVFSSDVSLFRSTLSRSISFHAGRNLLSPMTVVFRRFLRMFSTVNVLDTTTTITKTKTKTTRTRTMTTERVFAYIIPQVHRHRSSIILIIRRHLPRCQISIVTWLSCVRVTCVCTYYLKDRKRLRGVKLLMFVLRGRCLDRKNGRRFLSVGTRVAIVNPTVSDFS